jgi:hypothetical protein
MSYRMKITLPDPTMAQLETLAEQRRTGVPHRSADGLHRARRGKGPRRDDSSISASSPATAPDRNAPWIEPVLGDPEWRSYMWGSIVALYGRYPHALAHLKDGWWEDAAHVEVLCALVVWRDWIDQVAEDPRYELAFHAQPSDYSRELRQEGGGVTRAWQPGAAPDGWAR